MTYKIKTKIGPCASCSRPCPTNSQKKFCQECKDIRDKNRSKNWVVENREKYNASVRKYRAKRYEEEGRWYDTSPKASALRSWMEELKSKPCLDCKEKFPICCMDFDHRDGTIKEYNVGSMFAHHYSRELIEKELEKCDLVCSNCHRIRTRDRRLGSGKHGKKTKVA